MNNHVLKVVEEISRDIVALAQFVLDNDSIGVNRKTGRNTLKDSIMIKDADSRISFGSNGDNAVIEILFNNYIDYIEKGRSPGKMPPISALKEWAQSRGISTGNSTLFAIANAIKRDGIEGRPILATLEREIEISFENEWYDKLFEAMTSELNKYFDN
ncbi:MAG: hypothetical protein LBL79_09640 [Prevotella sp.]|jgi:hypothetical protein|nr:hypothetical protein [Prevotella sp.]